MKQFLKIFFVIEASLAGVCYTIVAIAMISDVFARELFNYSIYGVQRVAVLFVITTAYLGLGLATARNQHLRPRFADGWVPPAISHHIARVGDVLSALAFFVMGYFALQLVQTSFKWDDKVNVILIPLWTIQWVMPYGFFSAALRFLIFALRPDLKPAEQESN